MKEIKSYSNYLELIDDGIMYTFPYNSLYIEFYGNSTIILKNIEIPVNSGVAVLSSLDKQLLVDGVIYTFEELKTILPNLISKDTSAPVKSVNGKTGDVIITASDINDVYSKTEVDTALASKVSSINPSNSIEITGTNNNPIVNVKFDTTSIDTNITFTVTENGIKANANITQFKVIVVDELPAEGSSLYFYLVKTSTEGLYNEYIWAEISPNVFDFVFLGDTNVDLNDYVTNEELTIALLSKVDVITFEYLEDRVFNLENGGFGDVLKGELIKYNETVTPVDILYTPTGNYMEGVADTTSGTFSVEGELDGLVVVWGDGTAPETVSGSYVEHTYVDGKARHNVIVDTVTESIGLKEKYLYVSYIELNKLHTNETDLSSLFQYTNLIKINDGEYYIPNITNINKLFNYCRDLSDLSGLRNWIIDNVTDMKYLFYGCTILSDLSPISNWNTSNVTDMSYMFYENTSLIDLSGLRNWNVGNVTNMSYMFSNCSSLIDLSPLTYWNTSNVTTMSDMFRQCSSLVNIIKINPWNVDNVTDMSGIFANCINITSSQNNVLANWRLPNVENMSSMFGGTSITEFNILPFLSSTKLNNIGGMFSGCNQLFNINRLSQWDVSNVIYITNLFNGCTSLVDISPIKDWNIGNVTDMNYMFRDCTSLVDISPLKDWNVGNVINMRYLFNGCASLVDISPIKDWNIVKLNGADYMFSGCTLIERFEMSTVNEVINRINYMFDGCTGLKYLDFSNFGNLKFIDYDTSFVRGCTSVTEAYGRTEDDCFTLNTSPNKPDNITFIVK